MLVSSFGPLSLLILALLHSIFLAHSREFLGIKLHFHEDVQKEETKKKLKI